MTAQHDRARRQSAHRSYGRSQSFLIALRAPSERRSMRPELAERKIAAKHGHSRETERVSQLSKQGRLAIRAGAVRKNQAIRAGVR